MVDGDQQINTVLIPESGLNLAPEYVLESFVSPNFSRVFAHLVGKAANNGILIRATSDGRLHVVSAGVPFEEYLTFNGTCANAFAPGQTHEFAVSYNATDFLIETFPAIISFRNLAHVWLPEKILPVGMHSIDFIHYGVRLRNRIPASNSVYEITPYR